MPLGSRGAGQRAPRTHYPALQGPDDVEGGGGGGGTAPTAPSSVTTPTPANFVMGFGSKLHLYQAPATYQGFKNTLGYDAFATHTGYLPGFGGSQCSFKTTTAAGDATPGPYDYQRAMQGLPSTGTQGGNGGQSGVGLFMGKAAGHVSKVYLKNYFTRARVNNVFVSPGPFGDHSNSAIRAEVAARYGDMAGFLANFNGDGIVLDLEQGTWTTPPAGMTQAQYYTYHEQIGYEVGVAIYTAFPACEVMWYSCQYTNSWHQVVNDYPTLVPPNGTARNFDARQSVTRGLMRAHQVTNSTAPIRWLDHWWYRYASGIPGVSAATGLKWNTQGTLAGLSRDLSAAVWNQVAPYFEVNCFCWAGTDGGGSFYDSEQPSGTEFVDWSEIYRQNSMGGFRCNYQFNGLPNSASTQGFNVPNPDEYTPASRPAGMLAVANNTSTSYSAVAPTLSATKSGSGSTRALSGTASHPLGIARIKAYIYPSGTPVHAQMTFNLGGGSMTTNINNCYMDWTTTLTGVGSNQYAIVTAYSVQNQQKSVVVAL